MRSAPKPSASLDVEFGWRYALKLCHLWHTLGFHEIAVTEVQVIALKIDPLVVLGLLFVVVLKHVWPFLLGLKLGCFGKSPWQSQV